MQLTTKIVSFTLAATVSSAAAGLPTAHTWPMEHIMVSMNGSNLEAHTNTDAANPVEMLRFADEAYDGNASALENQFYSDQYGWVLDGIVDPGFGNSIWIELTSQSAGLETYQGGRRMMITAQTFDPIFGTAGSDLDWQWDGVMTHNWYAASDLGDYEASYRIYIGDTSGDPVAGFGETSLTINLRAVPAPSGFALLGIGSLITIRRKRA